VSFLFPSRRPCGLRVRKTEPLLTQSVVPVAPATGTPETGGWSTRELRTILRGLDGINLIAADIVEVAVRSVALSLSLLPSFLFLPFSSLSLLSGGVLTAAPSPVQPAYDTNAELTTMAAADALYEIMSIMVKRGPLSLDDEAEAEL